MKEGFLTGIALSNCCSVLDNNRLTNLADNTFQQVSVVTALSLNGNMLSQLAAGAAFPPSLVELYGTTLSAVADAMFYCCRLQATCGPTLLLVSAIWCLRSWSGASLLLRSLTSNGLSNIRFDMFWSLPRLTSQVKIS